MDIKTATNLILHPNITLERIKNAIIIEMSYSEIFVENSYHWLLGELKPNTTVLDLGGFIGDTAIYFANSKNVKEVIVYEPSIKWINLAKKYIALSPNKSKIKLINAGISHDGLPRAMARLDGLEFLKYKTDGKGIKTKSIKLSDALKGLKNVAIKCDIEGAEEYIFNNVNLKEVYVIEIECHYGNEKIVIPILTKKGFTCTTAKTKYPEYILLNCKRNKHGRSKNKHIKEDKTRCR